MDQYVIPVRMPAGGILIADFSLEIDSQDLTLSVKFPAPLRAAVISLLDSGKAEIVLNEMKEKFGG